MKHKQNDEISKVFYKEKIKSIFENNFKEFKILLLYQF